MLKRVLRCVVIWSCCVTPAAVWAAEAGAADDAEGYTLPDVTVSAEAGADYTTLPERNLVERPFTPSPGLRTATSVVGRKEIEQMHAYSVVDALKYVPGAWTETRGRKVKSFFSVRGQRYPYPGYLIDGAWFREFHETNYYLGAANFDRIEVLRSSSAMIWGPGGMTGMVNLVPRTYARQETDFESMYGTHNTYRGHVAHGSAVNGFSYGLGAGYYHTDGSSGMNAGENMTNLFGRAQYRLAEDVTFSWTNFGLIGDRELKLAEPPASTTLQTREDSFDPMRTYLTVAKLRHEPSEDNSTEIIGNYGGRRFDGHRVGSSDWLEEDYEYGASVIHSKRLTEQNTARFNVLYNRWVSPTGKRFYVGNPADIRTYSAAVLDEHDFGKLDIGIGYRYTREHTRRFGGFNVEGSPSGGLRSVEVRDEWEDPMHMVNLGASYELSDVWTLFGNTSWGQIAAQSGMLDANLSKPDTETRNKYDLGLSRDLGSFGQASVTAFYVRQHDAALVTNDTITGPDGLERALFENGDRKNYGVEFEIRSNRFENGLQFFANLTGMKTKRTRSGEWETDKEVPDWLFGGGVSYVRDRFEWSLYGRHVASYENQRFLPGGSMPAPLGDYVDLTAQMTYNQNENTEYFIRVENLTDEEYSTVAGYPHDGALFYAGLVKRCR